MITQNIHSPVANSKVFTVLCLICKLKQKNASHCLITSTFHRKSKIMVASPNEFTLSVLSGCSFNKQRQHRLLERRGGGDDATWGAGEDHHHHHHHYFMIIMIITLCVPPRWPILWWLSPIGCPLYSWGKRMGAWNDEWGIWGLIGLGSELISSSAGGLVTAVAPVVVESQGTWVITKQ